MDSDEMDKKFYRKFLKKNNKKKILNHRKNGGFFLTFFKFCILKKSSIFAA